MLYDISIVCDINRICGTETINSVDHIHLEK